MAKYINADEMIADESEAYLLAQSKITDKIMRDINYVIHTKLQNLLADAPAADVAEVRHGRWEKMVGTDLWCCSICGNTIYSEDEKTESVSTNGAEWKMQL